MNAQEIEVWKAGREATFKALMPQPSPKPTETPKEMLKRLRSWSHKLAHKVGVHFCEACGGAFPDDKAQKKHECHDN